MTQEDKELLLKDLCARLPYGVVLVDSNGDRMPLDYKGTIVNKRFTEVLSDAIEEYQIRPCLRPMSSMTEEEFKEYHSMLINIDKSGLMIQKLITKVVDWLDQKMFDHRGLIPKGLALEAPEEI